MGAVSDKDDGGMYITSSKAQFGTLDGYCMGENHDANP